MPTADDAVRFWRAVRDRAVNARIDLHTGTLSQYDVEALMDRMETADALAGRFRGASQRAEYDQLLATVRGFVVDLAQPGNGAG